MYGHKRGCRDARCSSCSLRRFNQAKRGRLLDKDCPGHCAEKHIQAMGLHRHKSRDLHRSLDVLFPVPTEQSRRSADT
eukprot:4625869-Amphidinium_carterae.1